MSQPNPAFSDETVQHLASAFQRHKPETDPAKLPVALDLMIARALLARPIVTPAEAQAHKASKAQPQADAPAGKAPPAPRQRNAA